MSFVNDSVNKCKNVFKAFLFYFPARDDGLWNYVIPISGVALSCFSFSMYVSFIEYGYFNGYKLNQMYNYGYLILSSVVGIDLYYGLLYNNKSRFGFWILSKAIDLLLLMILLVLRFDEYTLYAYTYVVIMFIVANVCLMCYVVRKVWIIPQEPVKAGSEITNINPINLHV